MDKHWTMVHVVPNNLPLEGNIAALLNEWTRGS